VERVPKGHVNGTLLMKALGGDGKKERKFLGGLNVGKWGTGTYWGKEFSVDKKIFCCHTSVASTVTSLQFTVTITSYIYTQLY